MAAAMDHQGLQGEYESFFNQMGYEPKIDKCVSEHLSRNRAVNAPPSSSSGGKGNAVSQGPVGSICPRLRVRMTDMRSFNPLLAQQLISNPLRHLRALELACHMMADESTPGYDLKDQTDTSSTSNRIKVSLVGPLSATPSSPRTLLSSSLGRLVCLEGVTTKVSSSKPKLIKSVHYCPASNSHTDRTYVDATDVQLGLHKLDTNSGMEMQDTIISISNTVYPTKDKEGNPLETEFGLSDYKDFQTITLQEMPERAPMGQLPRSIDLVLESDLVDQVKPGDRIQVMGVHRAMTPQGNVSHTGGTFRTVILVNHVQSLGRGAAANLQISRDDVREFRALAKEHADTDILDVLGRSLAPSIHGHDMIKKAIVLQLLGGVERNLKNGTHLRGDVNILMVGDPSTAKSQLLRAAMIIAPLAVSTTGKGSSGVGLTAAVTSDPDTRERRLEAGAMVLADRGMVCVDEFDKMSEADRVTIHEAMEQQTVTIAKAGIHASLNARCSVLAAANPVYGQYDKRRRPQENIGLPDSLLSRFDLLFVVLDQLDPSSDRLIASHVLRGHRYRRPGTGVAPEQPGALSTLMEDSDDDSDDDMIANAQNAGSHSNVWQRSHHQFTQSTSDQQNDDPHSEDILTQDFLRKYLHFAKARMSPILMDEARETIASRYAEMRGRQDDRTLPVTARSLETIIRLASAHAKARLSPTVDSEPDVSAAMSLLRFALYHEQDPNAGVTEDDAAVTAITDDDDETPSTKDQVMEDAAEDAETNVRGEGGDEPIPKRLRAGEEGGDQSLVTQIWDALNQAGGELDYADLDDMSGAKESAKMRAITEMVNDGRIMFEDNKLYQV
jgi:DNA replication licensing factor MCM3